MADPIPPTPTDPTVAVPTQDQIDKWTTFEQVTAASGSSLEKVGDISTGVGVVFNVLSDKLKMAGISFSGLSSMTDQTSRQFGLLTTSVLGTREAFTNLSGVMDTSRLVTYMDQFKELGDILKAGPGTQMAANAIEAIIGKMGSLGASSATVAKVQQELKTGVMTTAAAFFTSADNITRLQYSMMQMTTAGSGMQTLLDAVGSDFQNLDKVTEAYTNTLNKVTASLGGSKKAQETAALYMAQINKMPGGLNILTKSTEIAGKQTDLLTASINIAAISGRKEEEVLEDINKVLQGYKSALDDSNDAAGAAATLTARMATIAGTLHANIQDVRGALMESTDAFKMFVMDGASAADMTKGMADAMENYTSSLEAVGVPAANAIEMFKNYTGVMKNMNLGQQAFLSTMSGGAGGLRGAFQIQDKIARGDFEGLRRDAEATIKKLTGPIVSREQAMKSEQAAATYTRQIQILQQGPLGSMAKTMPEAEALLKAMQEGKKMPAATTEKSPENKMQDAMKAGQKIQQDSYTELTKINTSLNTLVLQAGLANKKTTRDVLGTGNTGAYAGGVEGTGAGITPGRTGIGVPSNDALQKVAEVARELPKTVKDAWESFKEVIGTGNRESIQKANDRMVAAIKDQRAVWNSLSESQKAALSTTQQAFSVMKPAAPTTGAPGTKAPGKTGPQTSALSPLAPGAPRMNFTPVENYARPGQRIPAPLPPSNTAATTGGPTGPGARQQGGIGQGAPGQAVPVMLAPGSAITVNLTGVCPHCGRDINHSQTDRGVSQGSNAP